jgi:hypothetical protein
MRVAQLFCYPVKSLGGFPVDRMHVGPLGPRHDRQWVVVDERGMFLAQRAQRRLGVAVRAMCLVRTRIEGDRLVLAAPDVPPLAVALDGVEGPSVDVTIWDDRATGVDQGPEASAWLGEVLGRHRPGTYRLVRMADAGTRRTRQDDAWMGYADGYPLLVATQASLDDLNARIQRRRAEAGEPPVPPLGWDRFRPNVVVAGAAAYAEDEWETVDLGDVRLQGRTQCKRCPIPSTDQDTGRLGQEPLRTLATYRRDPDDRNAVVFARNFTHRSTGRIAVGDAVRAC